ncbi:unnamed protein product [Callosobruchus maculatus]|uniref:PLAT domain-containing protein n=1 Tax=Callosobruchus maculatus TaxID=64391 RepID=A0A653CIP6_CALMS|nr:unnamed protein product [Callosobruchus maculatus]
MANTITSLLIFVALVLICLVSSTFASDVHNIVQCPDAIASNRSLYLTNIFEGGAFLQRKTRNIHFPEVGHNLYKITCLKITDQDSRGKGGTARVVSGGYGSYDIEILLRSALGGDINYRIELWSDE